jgi:hypothetical protein
VGNLLGDTTRLAVVLNTSEPAPSLEQAINILLKRTGVTLPFQGGSDLLFQINLKKALNSATGREINRLLKWAAEVVQSVEVSGGPPIMHTAFLSTLSVDVNTVPSSQNFTADQQASILEEMADEAERLCQENSLTALSRNTHATRH